MNILHIFWYSRTNLCKNRFFKKSYDKQSLKVPVNVVRVILEIKNDISRIKHSLEILAIRSPGLEQAKKSCWEYTVSPVPYDPDWVTDKIAQPLFFVW